MDYSSLNAGKQLGQAQGGLSLFQVLTPQEEQPQLWQSLPQLQEEHEQGLMVKFLKMCYWLA